MPMLLLASGRMCEGWVWERGAACAHGQGSAQGCNAQLQRAQQASKLTLGPAVLPSPQHVCPRTHAPPAVPAPTFSASKSRCGMCSTAVVSWFTSTPAPNWRASCSSAQLAARTADAAAPSLPSTLCRGMVMRANEARCAAVGPAAAALRAAAAAAAAVGMAAVGMAAAVKPAGSVSAPCPLL